MTRALLIFLFVSQLFAEVHTLTLQEAVAIALKQNPDVLISRIDRQRAELSARAARDPFLPKVYAGSGLAYTYGYPLSIDGSAPSIVQVKAQMSVYNPVAKYQAAQANENVRGAAQDEAARRDEIAHRIGLTFADAQFLAQARESARSQAASFEKVAETVGVRVNEGRELPVELSRAGVNLLRARQRLTALDADADYAEENLAVLLGYGPGDRVRAVEGSSPTLAATTASEAVATALANSKDVRRLESQILAKGYEAKSQRAQRLPKIDLIAQYGLFAKFNNFADYFQRFQRNNATLGASIQLPIVAPAASRELAKKADIEVERLKLEITATKDRLALETRRSWLDSERADRARQLAKADLDLAREQLNVLLAQHAEGRTSLRQVEEARTAENERWIAFYDAGLVQEKARLNLLRQTGEIVAAITATSTK